MSDNADPKASKASLIKNLLFAAFIILAIFFCFSQFNKSEKIKDVNRAIELLDQAREASPMDIGKAQEALAILDEYQEADFNDEKVIAEYVKAKSLCYSTLAETPDFDAKESEQYYLKAFALDETNPDIPEGLRGQFQGLSAEERAQRTEMKRVAQQAMEEGAKELQRMEKGLVNEVQGTAEKAKDAAAQTAAEVQETAEKAKDAAAQTAAEVKETAEKAVEQAKEAAKDAADEAKDAAENALDALKDAAEKAAE